MSDVILSIKDLKVSYGGIEAVKGISFDVRRGEIVTLIGANGAGKSSTLRAIAGLVKPSGGSITFEGENITGADPTSIVKRGVTLVPEGRRIFADLTVLENLKIGAYLRHDDLKEDLEWVYSLFPRLKERSWQAGGTLSGGEQQMLAVGRALMSRPKLIMMDRAQPGPRAHHRPASSTSSRRYTSAAPLSSSSSRMPTWPCKRRTPAASGDGPYHPHRHRRGAAEKRSRPGSLPRHLSQAAPGGSCLRPGLWQVCGSL